MQIFEIDPSLRYPSYETPSPLHEREKPAAMAAMTVSAVSMRAVVAPKRVAARKAAASRAQVRHAPARDGSLEIVFHSLLVIDSPPMKC